MNYLCRSRTQLMKQTHIMKEKTLYEKELKQHKKAQAGYE